MALTVKKLPRLIKRGMYLDRDGLYLQAKSPDSRSWVLRFERHGKKRWMGLGSLATFSLEAARQRARKARQMLADGIDPLLARREQQAKQAAADARSKDFRTVCSEYFNAHGDAWVARHRVNFINSLKNHAYPIIGSLPIAAVDVALVLKVLQPIWKEKIRTAQALQRRMASVFDFAIAAGYVSDNPAAWKSNLQHLLPAADRLARVQHHPALPFAEIAGFVSELRNVDGVAARALEFLILTAARSDEVIGARWDEIKFDEAQWVVPAARMKNKREHRVPLSAQAIRLLRSLPREEGNGFVFIGRKAGSAMGENALLKALRQLRDDVTVHGFRSSFRDWAAERTAFAYEVAEQALAHTIGNKVERSYRRTTLPEQRARLMTQWASYVDAPPAADADVVPMRRA